jgi:hypothetical protein
VTKFPAAAAVGAIALVACTITASPSTTPNAGTPSAASAAADLRVHINLLVGEHVYVVAKLMTAASGGRKDEYHSYAVLLATNGGDLADVISRAVGASAGQRFTKVWSEGNNYFVDYVVAQATHNADNAQAAAAKLASTYVPDLAQFLTNDVGIPADRAGLLAGVETDGLRTVLDDQSTGSFTKAYPDLLVDYAHSTSLGDEVGISIARRYVDRIPGDPSNVAAGHRAHLDALLQEHAFLTTMATESVLAGVTAEQGPAGLALASVSSAIAQELGSVLGPNATPGAESALKDHNATFLAYAAAADAPQRETLRTHLTNDGASTLATALHVPALSIAEQTAAVFAVIDAQRTKSYDQLSLDDRAAASYLSWLGDVITGVTATQ